VLPSIVLLGVPGALLGALGALWMRGLTNDVYCQIGLVMLIGLASKNAILIVELRSSCRSKVTGRWMRRWKRRASGCGLS